jgi:hypothetical protein
MAGLIFKFGKNKNTDVSPGPDFPEDDNRNNEEQ